jgi:hypothetical protein
MDIFDVSSFQIYVFLMAPLEPEYRAEFGQTDHEV